MREIDENAISHGRSHSVLIENRKKVTITGVEDVDSFDESTVVLLTGAGYINLEGVDLHINKLNLEDGQLIIEGEIFGIQYSEAENSRRGQGMFGRLFR